MKTKIDRVPTSFVEFVQQKAEEENKPRTRVYMDIEQMLKYGINNKVKKYEKPLFKI
jgi:hypothetical protein